MFLVGSLHHTTSAIDDNEFAEFEDVDDDVTPTPKPDAKSSASAKPDLESERTAAPAKNMDVDDVEIEDEADEFSHLEDDEEFVNVQGRPSKSSHQESQGKEPSLRIANIPAHLRTNWFNFQVEIIMLLGLIVYLVVYCWGRTSNHNLASTWFEIHRELLEANFHLVGDDGISQEPQHGLLMKESDSSYRIWCSGRAGCQGLSIQIKLAKRQDLVSLVSSMFRPISDKVVIKVVMNSDEMDSFVFAAGAKKSVTKLAKELVDLLSEIGEATATLVDAKVSAIISKYEECVDYIYLSDQYTGIKAQEGESVTRLPETSKVLIFSFKLLASVGKFSESGFDEMKPLMQMVIHCIDKVRRFKLSKEAKLKSEKNRQRIEESFLKTTHAARVEAAQARKEERIKERKDRIMNEDDPEKQKRLEKQELKREAKRKQPKVKQLKIKA